MLRNIILFLLFNCLFLNFSMSANAENKFITPLKAPFSLFEDKKNKEDVQTNQNIEETKDANLNLQIEKVKKQQKSQKVYDPKNTLGVIYAKNVINKAKFYIEEEDYESAKEALNSINEWVYNATEYHTNLFKILQKVDNSEAQADIERDLAMKFAVLRDRSLFLDAKVHIANGEEQQAVENLVEVIRSQPSTDLGFKAYDLLQKIGFTYKVNYQILSE